MEHFTENHKNQLLDYARHILCRELCNEYDHFELTSLFIDTFSAKCGLFVSLYNKDHLRACLGRISSDLPLYKTVEKMTIAAATKDHRFDKITAGEVNELTIELSVLTPLKQINTIDEIIIGKHGILIEKAGMSGTFLPQVAINQNWNTEEFLGHCAESKAGIGWLGWKDAKISTYEAITISDHKEL